MGVMFAASILAITLVACGGDEQPEQSEELEGEEAAAGEEANVEQESTYNTDDIPEVIATVNGEEIDNELYIAYLQQEVQTLTMQGVDLESEEATSLIEGTKKQLLDYMVDERIILQEAEKEGITASEEDIDAEIATYLKQYQIDENELEKRLSEQGMTMEEIRADFEAPVIRNKYIDQFVTVPEVTEEELQTTYDEIVASASEAEEESEIPTFDEYREELKNYLVGQKKQEELGALLEKLREEYEITTFM